MIYLSGHICKEEFRHPRLGFMLSPRMGQNAPKGSFVAIDNGCFGSPEDYSDAWFLRFLDRMPRERALFAVAPDVLENHDATIERSLPILARIRQLGFPAAFVAQDGWKATTTPWDEFDVLFIGGSTEFKFRGGREAAKAANQHGKAVHMGRVNSLQRLRAAVSIGCDSADGTFLKFGPDTNWPRLERWLTAITEQSEMQL